MSGAIIEVEGLSKSFDGKFAVRNLSMSVRQGEIFGFLGPNGSGKTTSIRLLCGLLTPDAGQGRCLGFDIRRHAREIKRRVGYMTQGFSYYEDLSVRENLEFIASIYEVQNPHLVVQRALEQLGLTPRQKQLAGALSGGWKQRLALAACLLHEPKLLLLDEPTAGVDPQARREFWNEIHRLAAQGVTVLVSTHYMDEAERCHRLAYMTDGRLLAQGAPSELMAASGLVTWSVGGGHDRALEQRLRELPAVEDVVSFGTTLYVSGTDAAALETQLTAVNADRGLVYRRVSPRLEDVFVHLMRTAAEGHA
ncbi:MAG: ABC transporter ATP-binding protein [Nevskiales bacterium]|nr:ABC transporter ATP-binding protein [Nevskiales bacterium]